MKSGICLRSETGEPDCVTIEAERPDTYLKRVILCYNVDETASIEGFTITGGDLNHNPDPDALPYGAGIYCENSSPRVINCIFSENLAYDGGAMWCENGFPTISGCTFSGNMADIGSAIVCFPSATITNCTFISNVANWSGCIAWSGSPVDRGSGTVTDCVFWDNRTRTGGGGIDCWGSSIVISGCTFFGNSSGSRGDIQCFQSSVVEIENTIIASSTSGKAVHCDDGSSATLTCCDIYGNAGGDWVGCIADQYGINGNFSVCPSFCHADDGDFYLCDESPCLPGNHPDGYECGLIGAWGEGCGCGPSLTEPTTWGALKSMYK
jgi:hypothetical protein